jgi:hypothetical protein
MTTIKKSFARRSRRLTQIKNPEFFFSESASICVNLRANAFSAGKWLFSWF